MSKEYQLSRLVEPIGGVYKVDCRGLLDILKVRATILANETARLGLSHDTTNTLRGQRLEVTLLLDSLEKLLPSTEQ